MSCSMCQIESLPNKGIHKCVYSLKVAKLILMKYCDYICCH